MISIIENMRSLKDIVRYFGSNRAEGMSVPDHNWTYNIRNLLNTSDKRTIEFRQHCGTLDFEQVKRWIHFCVLSVKLSHLPTNPWIDLVDRVGDPKFSVLDALSSTFMEGLVGDFTGEIYHHDRNIISDYIWNHEDDGQETDWNEEE